MSSMRKVTIYTKLFCPYCSRALALLKAKGVEINEIAAGADPEKREEMIARAGGAWTFPQIFIGDKHVGGCDDLMALDRAGKLDPMLNAD